MNEPGRLPGGDARSRFLTELPARTQALTTLAFQFSEDPHAWAKRRELQMGLEALERAAEAAGEQVIAEHAREALACLSICERSEQETSNHIVAELQMLVDALPWLALSDQPLPLESSAPLQGQSMPVPAAGSAAGSGANAPAGTPRYSMTVPSRVAPGTKSWEQTGSRRRPAIDQERVPEDEVWAPMERRRGPAPPVTPPAAGSSESERAAERAGRAPSLTETGPRVRADRDAYRELDPFVMSSAVDEAEFELSDGPVVLTQTVSGLAAPTLLHTVLVVDRPDVVAQVRASLARKRYDVVGAFDGEEALLLLPTVEPDVVLVGELLAEQPDTHLVMRLREDPDCAAQHVLLLGAGGEARAAELGCDGWVPTPIVSEVLNEQLDARLGVDSGGGGRLDQLTEGTVDDIAAGVAEEIRRGLVQSLRAGRDERIVLDDRQELMAAAWTAIGRVRSHLAQRAGGRVQFVQGADEAGHEGAAPELSAELAGRRVLVADDDPAVLWFFAGLLRDAKAEVFEAKNGREALSLAREYRPELVISDILMPKLDGFAFCRELKRDALLWDVPVVLLSWKEDFLLRMRELDCGAVGFLRKEAGGEQIIGTVRQVLRPWTRLAAHLRSPKEVHGRIEQVGVYSLLQKVAHYRPDARVTVRDVFNIYEIGLRDGQHVSAHRTAADGSFARGEIVLQALLGVRSGRFSVEITEGPLRGALAAPLASALLSAAQRLNALLQAVSAPRIHRISKVLFDNRTLLALSEASPRELTAFVRTLLKEDTPLCDRLRSGELDGDEVELQLRELARLGAISAVSDVLGADLIAAAYRLQIEGGATAFTEPEQPPPRSGARSGYRGEFADMSVPASTHPGSSAEQPAAVSTASAPTPAATLIDVPPPAAAGVSQPVPSEAPQPAAPAEPLEAFQQDEHEEIDDDDIPTEDVQLGDWRDAPDTDADSTRDTLRDVHDGPLFPGVAVVPPAAVSSSSLPPFLTATGNRRARTLAGLGESTLDPLDATAGFELLAAGGAVSSTTMPRFAVDAPPSAQSARPASAEPLRDQLTGKDTLQGSPPPVLSGSAPARSAGSETESAAAVAEADLATSELVEQGTGDDAGDGGVVDQGALDLGDVDQSAADPDAARQHIAGQGADQDTDRDRDQGTAQDAPPSARRDAAPAAGPSASTSRAASAAPPPLPSQAPPPQPEQPEQISAPERSASDVAEEFAPSPLPEDVSGLRPAVATPAPSRWPQPAGRVGPVVVRLLALLFTLALVAVLISALWSLRGSAVLEDWRRGRDDGKNPASSGAAERVQGVDGLPAKQGTAGQLIGGTKSNAQADENAGGVVGSARPTADGVDAPLDGADGLVDPAGEVPASDQSDTSPEVQVDDVSTVGVPRVSRAGEGSAVAGPGTLSYIDTSYGVDVADDEGLLVVRFDADGTPPSVRIGDRDLGLAPTAVALPAGRHEVVFRRSGQTRFRYLVIRRGQTRIVDVP